MTGAAICEADGGCVFWAAKEMARAAELAAEAISGATDFTAGRNGANGGRDGDGGREERRDGDCEGASTFDGGCTKDATPVTERRRREAGSRWCSRADGAVRRYRGWCDDGDATEKMTGAAICEADGDCVFWAAKEMAKAVELAAEAISGAADFTAG
ncbi:C2 domain-containing protein, partial [Sesbania bispinosa]